MPGDCALQRQALAQAWAAQAALRPAAPCPHCRGTQLRPAGSKPRQIETIFGPVQLPRRRCAARGVGTTINPMMRCCAPCWGRAAAPRRCASWRPVVAPVGRTSRRPAWWDGCVALPCRPKPSAPWWPRPAAWSPPRMLPRRMLACQPPATAPDPDRSRPARLVVELDGAWVRSHDNAHGMEAKVGVIHAGSERDRAHPHPAERPALRRHLCRGGRVWSAGDRRRGAAQRLRGTGADPVGRWGGLDLGAGTTILAEATAVLDRWHLADARRRALRRAVPRRPERTVWAQRLRRTWRWATCRERWGC